MKYYYVWYNKGEQKYKIQVEENIHVAIVEGIVVFKSFDMAYQYISVLNGRGTDSVYSRWTVSR